jgi:predicted Zn-dependent protease
MRQKNLNASLKYANELINLEPQNPYFWEIKAQTLFENGRLKEAKNAYRQMLDLKPYADLFKLSYAEAVLAAEPTRREMEELIPLLEQTNRYQNFPSAYLYLGRIYADMGQLAIADYFAAEYSYSIGETETARKQLAKALKQNLRSDIKLRAEDLKAKLDTDNRKRSLF